MALMKNIFGGSLKPVGILFSIFLLGFKFSTAQIFPIQANINVAPPYSVYLSQYTSAEQEKVMVNLLLLDQAVNSVDVKFRFTIEGAGIKLTTNPGWNPPPFNLTGGVLVTLPQNLIADYLRPQNLLTEGVNPQEFFRSGKLPEGFYEFKVEVVEYRRGITISNIGRTGLWLLLNEPPRIVFPMAGQKVMASNPQMLNFTWIPSGASSPLSSLNTQYEFTLVELVDKSVDPTVAITTASNANKFVKTVDQTSLFYGPGDMPLTLGKSYAIRVKAFNTEGYEMFKNGGYSELCTFTFGDACVKPVSFTLGSPNQSSFEVNVYTDPSNTAWQAHFREKADSEGEWSELKSEPGTPSKTIKGLKPKTEYELQVKGLCGDFVSEYTTSQTITTSQMVDANRSCTENPTPFAVDNVPSLAQLKVDDFFLAALFPVRVKEVKSQGGGKFTGRGIATLPLFNTGLAVTFDNIGINQLRQLTSGEVKVVRDKLNMTLFGETQTTTGGGSGGGTGTGGNPGDTITYPPITGTITIPAVYDSLVVTNNGTVIVYPPNGGAPVTVDLGGSSCTVLVPADGNMDNAKIVYDGAVHPYTPSQTNVSTTDPVNFTGLFAKFKANSQQTHGFDTLNPKHSIIANYYKQLTIAGKQYYLPWKALMEGIPEPVNLFIKQGTDKMPFSNLKVDQTGKGDLTPISGAGTQAQTYNLQGSYKGLEESVVAYYNADGKEQFAGGIYLATFGERNLKVFLVPLGSTTVDPGVITQLQNGLNDIYSQAVVKWSVSPLEGMPTVELGDNGLDWADKDMLSSYNAEMNSVISTFKGWKPDADPDAYYLFIVPKFSEGGVEGFMPRNRRFGFITKEQIVDRTVAHELGHGAFNLKHTFSDWAITQGSTDNLMDYSEGKKLWKPQWDYIHNPEVTTGLWDGMEDGAFTTTPISENYTVLFDHIYRNNKKSNMIYFNKIDEELASGNSKQDINLIYKEDESSKWSPGEKAFIDRWKIRVINSNDVFNDVIKAVQLTEDGDKISKIVLRPKNIYFGKYTYEGIEYPVAIYGNGKTSEMINAFTKRKVENPDELKDKKNIDRIYCDETPLDYMIIGFYEDGKAEPSMIMQIEKFDISKFQFTKEKWLEFLNIYKPDSRKAVDGLITLYENDKEIKEPNKFFAKINETPEMPNNLKIRFNGNNNEKAEIITNITYRINYEYKGDKYYFNDGTTIFKIKEVEVGKDYPLFFDKIRGGTVTLSCETKDKKEKVVFHIRGINPTRSQVESYQMSKGFSNFWFLSAMTSHESSFMQFCNVKKSLSMAPIDEKKTYNGPFTSSEGQEGLPLYGGPKGFGLKQLDNWMSNGISKNCSAEQRWNWKANIDGGLDVISTKINDISLVYTEWKNEVNNWNNNNQKNKISMDDYVFGGSKNKETFSYSDSPIFPDLNFTGGTPSSGKYSFLDAILIGKYNGGLFLFQLVVPDTKNSDNENLDLKPYWILKSTYTYKEKTYDNTIYINDICNNN